METIRPIQLKATNIPADNKVPTYDAATMKFTWEAMSGAGGGDMYKSEYDSNDDGIVNQADSALAVVWGNITSKPITDGQITDLTDGGQTTLHSHPAGSGASTFLELTDTPDSYSGQAGKYPKVNAGETALEFTTISGSGSSTLAGLTDVAVSGVTNGQSLVYNDSLNKWTPVLVSGSSFSGGWIPATGTWTYSSADAPTYVISVDNDQTALINVGSRIKLTHSSAVKYFLVTAVGSYAGGVTLITVYGGTDYTLSASAISSVYYSREKAPFGFPLNPAKWMVSVTDATGITQSSPVQNTWYNANSITIPIGAWRVKYICKLAMTKTAATWNDPKVTLSTANNSESNVDNTNNPHVGTQQYHGSAIFHEIDPLDLAAKTVYYLNILSPQTQVTTTSIACTFIRLRAISAYL